MPKRWRAGAGTVVYFMPPTGFKTLDNWIAPQRKAAIARIVKAVDIAPSDEVRLATDIFWAYTKTPSDLGIFQSSEAKRRLKKVQRILGLVEEVATLIASDDFISPTINNVSSPFQISSTNRLIIEARSVVEQLTLAARKGPNKADLPRKLKDRRASELEWLAGVSLPLVYERHFSRRAGRSRNAAGQPSGPAIVFIDATFKELRIPYKPESIVRAFTRLTRQRDNERVKRSGK